MKIARLRNLFWLIMCIFIGLWMLGIVGAIYEEIVPKRSYGYLIYSKDTLSAIQYLVTDGDTARMELDSNDLRKGYDTFEKNRFYSNGGAHH